MLEIAMRLGLYGRRALPLLWLAAASSAFGSPAAYAQAPEANDRSIKVAQTDAQGPKTSPPATAPSAQGEPKAPASTQLETVIVTARRQAENVERVPATVTALDPGQLKQQNIEVAADLQRVAPSLQIISAYTSLYSTFAVRGLATGVNTYFSDAPCCLGSIGGTPFLDIASVQVVDGPQGTLFGRSSAAGAVIIDPQHPKLNEFGGYIDAIGGTYGRGQFTGVVNIPIIADHLAIRLDANSNHVDGYTNVLGSETKLDEINNQQYRIGVELKFKRFENYFLANYQNINETGTSEILGGAYPNYSLYNLPPNTNTAAGLAAGQAYFGAVCQQAVGYGYSPNVNACINERLGILTNVKQVLLQEQARVQANGVRTALPSFDGLGEYNAEYNYGLIDVAQFDAGTFLNTHITFKNIASYGATSSIVSGPNDGLGGVTDEATFVEQGSSNGGSNEIGNVTSGKLPTPEGTFNEEFQIHGNVDQGLVIATLGAFYSNNKVPTTQTGANVAYKYFGGVFTPNLGNIGTGFSEGGYFDEEAGYGQATVNLSRWIHGLSLTGGYRYSYDQSLTRQQPVGYNYTTGTIYPDFSQATVVSSAPSQGYNYTLSASEQFTDKILGYFTRSRAYVPGGVNGYQAGNNQLPGFTQTYLPETVINDEVGFKADLDFAGVLARINLDVYRDQFTNIVEEFTADINGGTTFYFENAAAAQLQGIELQATVIPNRLWELSGSYNYNQGTYSNWISSDPLSLAQPGDAICLPSSPKGACYLNLKHNPFYALPSNQGHITVRFNVPVDAKWGDANLAVTTYYQSRVFFEADDGRLLQVAPNELGAVSQAPYATVQLRAEWNNVNKSGWNAAFDVSNLTDTTYATGKIEAPITSGYSVANYAAPRMFEFEVSRKFGGG